MSVAFLNHGFRGGRGGAGCSKSVLLILKKSGKSVKLKQQNNNMTLEVSKARIKIYNDLKVRYKKFKLYLSRELEENNQF